MYNVTIGMDLGDKKHQIHILDKNGKTIKVCQISNTAQTMKEFFSKYQFTLRILQVQWWSVNLFNIPL